MQVHELIVELQNYPMNLQVQVMALGSDWVFDEERGESHEVEILELSEYFKLELTTADTGEPILRLA